MYFYMTSSKNNTINLVFSSHKASYNSMLWSNRHSMRTLNNVKSRLKAVKIYIYASFCLNRCQASGQTDNLAQFDCRSSESFQHLKAVKHSTPEPERMKTQRSALQSALQLFQHHMLWSCLVVLQLKCLYFWTRRRRNYKTDGFPPTKALRPTPSSSRPSWRTRK